MMLSPNTMNTTTMNVSDVEMKLHNINKTEKHMDCDEEDGESSSSSSMGYKRQFPGSVKVATSMLSPPPASPLKAKTKPTAKSNTDEVDVQRLSRQNSNTSNTSSNNNNNSYSYNNNNNNNITSSSPDTMMMMTTPFPVTTTPAYMNHLMMTSHMYPTTTATMFQPPPQGMFPSMIMQPTPQQQQQQQQQYQAFQMQQYHQQMMQQMQMQQQQQQQQTESHATYNTEEQEGVEDVEEEHQQHSSGKKVDRVAVKSKSKITRKSPSAKAKKESALKHAIKHNATLLHAPTTTTTTTTTTAIATRQNKSNSKSKSSVHKDTEKWGDLLSAPFKSLTDPTPELLQARKRYQDRMNQKKKSERRKKREARIIAAVHSLLHATQSLCYETEASAAEANRRYTDIVRELDIDDLDLGTSTHNDDTDSNSSHQ